MAWLPAWLAPAWLAPAWLAHSLSAHQSGSANMLRAPCGNSPAAPSRSSAAAAAAEHGMASQACLPTNQALQTCCSPTPRRRSFAPAARSSAKLLPFFALGRSEHARRTWPQRHALHNVPPSLPAHQSGSTRLYETSEHDRVRNNQKHNSAEVLRHRHPMLRSGCRCGAWDGAA